MATSGRINGQTQNYSSVFSFYITWQQTKNDDGNYSDVAFTLYLSTSNTSYTFDTVNTVPINIEVGSFIKSFYVRLNCNPWVFSPLLLFSGSVKVPHDSDGSKSITVSALANLTGSGYTPGLCTVATQTLTLDPIIRRATITSAPNFKDTDNPKIYYSNPLGSSVAGLQACISLDGEQDDIPARDISKTGSSYTFNLTDTERNTLRNATSGTSRSVRFIIMTTIGETIYTDSVTKTFSIDQSEELNPDVSITATPNNEEIPSGIRQSFSGLYVQGKSKVNISVEATAKSGAYISSVLTSFTGKTYSGNSVTTATISSSGTLTATTVATDSVGRYNSTTTNLNVLPYSKPQVANVSGENSVKCYRSNAQGVADSSGEYVCIKAKKQYSPITVNGADLNTCTLRFRYKLASAQSFGTWTTLATDSNNEYVGVISGFPVANGYIFQVGVVDALQEESTIEFDAMANYPVVNIRPALSGGGDTIGIGKYTNTQYDLGKTIQVSSDWKAYFDGGFFGSHICSGPDDLQDNNSLLNFAIRCPESAITPFRTFTETTDLPPTPSGSTLNFKETFGFVYHPHQSTIRQVVIFDRWMQAIAICVYYGSAGSLTWRYIYTTT